MVAALPKQTQGSLSRGIGHLGTSIPPGRADPGGAVAVRGGDQPEASERDHAEPTWGHAAGEATPPSVPFGREERGKQLAACTVCSVHLSQVY